MNPTSLARQHAFKRYIGCDEDRISRLPDEILIDILSLLSLNEAVGTSVLSSRWINLWEHTDCLNLVPDTSALDDIVGMRDKRDKLKSEGPKYVGWVNRILRSHKALTLKEFRIKFPFLLDVNARESIASIAQWIEFAFARHVQRLELDLSPADPIQNKYCSHEELLTSPSGSPSMLLDYKCLRVLSFTSVNVTDRAIDFLLHNCPLLEQLAVHLSMMLSNVVVCGSSLVLKHLEIAYCHGLESLKVSAPGLTYLKLVGPPSTALLVENAPMLVEACIDRKLEDIQRLFSSHASQLEILRLRVVGLKDYISKYGKDKDKGNGKDYTSKLPQLPKLKKLLIKHEIQEPECFVRLMADLIRASPHLEEFVLENGWYKCRTPWKNEVVGDPVKSPHQHLKVVKYFGYCGLAADLQFVSYILENCVALETLIIELSVSISKLRRPHSLAKDKLKYGITGRNNVKQQLEELVKQQLEARVPRHVALVFL